MKIDLSLFKKAIDSLEEVLVLKKNAIIRDSAIQRFEYTQAPSNLGIFFIFHAH